MKRVYWAVWYRGDPKAKKECLRPGLCRYGTREPVLIENRADADAELKTWGRGSDDDYTLARVTVEVEPRKRSK